jgi:hypothetical protein
MTNQTFKAQAEDGTLVPSTVVDPADTFGTNPYTRDQMEGAFHKVCNPKDWKASIRAIINEADRDLVRRAISFFTATDCAFTPSGDGKLLVTSVGYRVGPAGDH